MEPSNPPSSRPTACSKVDLPDPDGPNSATISPGATRRSTPRRTSMVTSPWVKLRLSPRVSRTASLITEHLHGVRACRLVRRIERREEREDQRDQNDCGNLERIGLRWQIGQEPHGGIPEILAGNLLDRVHDVLPEVEKDRAKDDSEHDAERADRHADRDKDLHHASPARTHGAQDCDVSRLRSHQHYP